jgi:hypothetical protein
MQRALGEIPFNFFWIVLGKSLDYCSVSKQQMLMDRVWNTCVGLRDKRLLALSFVVGLA